VSKMIATLVEQGSAGRPKKEKSGLQAVLIKAIDALGSGASRH
jgi:hypothetical protein